MVIPMRIGLIEAKFRRRKARGDWRKKSIPALVVRIPVRFHGEDDFGSKQHDLVPR